MENIGKLLKEKRLELGFTIEEVSKKTRLTQKHIKALEEGKIDFFHDDLEYLRFFVKSYCEVLDIDFDDLKDGLRDCVNEYTTSFTTSMQMTHEEIEKQVAKTEKLTNAKSADRIVRRKKKFKKPDMSLVSLIAIVVIVAMVIMLAFIVFLKSNPKDKGSAKDNQPLATVPSTTDKNQYPTKDEQDKNKEKEEAVKKEVNVVKDGVTNYTIENVKDGDELSFEVYFGGSNSGFSATVDGKVLDDPQAKIYNYQTSAKGKIKVKDGTKIQLYIAYMLNTSLKINGKNVKIDESIVNSGGPYTLELTVAGDKDESTK